MICPYRKQITTTDKSIIVCQEKCRKDACPQYISDYTQDPGVYHIRDYCRKVAQKVGEQK